MTSCLRTRGPAPGGEAHVGGAGVGAFDDEFGRGVAGDGEEKFVLHFGEEVLGFLLAQAVVAADGEEVADFLVEAFFRGADFADAGKQLIEVIPAAGVFEALVVHDEAFDEIFAQVGGGPLAELRAAWRPDAVADGEDEVEVVVHWRVRWTSRFPSI